MKVVEVKSKITAGHRPCRHCGNAIKPGQWVLRQRLPNSPITDREITYHVVCIKALIADVPNDIDKTKESFDRLREKIVASGNLFPNDPELQGV